MRISYRWLKEFVDIDVSPRELADRLTMAGLEVDSIDRIETFGSVVGEIVDVSYTEKLALCKVDVGIKTINVATADKSVEVGEKFGVVLAGSNVGDKRIERRSFGDFVSEGMFLSAEELGLEESSSKLFRLDRTFENGKKLSDLDEFDDSIIEIELTPNRADALSMLGVARDVAAIFKKRVRFPDAEFITIDKEIDEFIDVKIEDYKNCPRYTLALADVEVKPAPFFMRMRLLKCGVRSINNIVDITNYVLLGLGQPMHAFDFSKLNGNIVVRPANKGEGILALDGKEYELKDDMLVIADQKGPVAIAGVMGGELSSVSDTTKTIALESAFFNPVSVRLTARRLKFHTESSHRFERGVDPNLALDASKYALDLLSRYANAKVYRGFIDRKEGEFKNKRISVSFDGVNKLLGSNYSSDEIVDVLVGLSFGVEQTKEGVVEVDVPTYRFDIEGQADIAEEVARIKGYNSITDTMPVVNVYFKPKDRVEFYANESVKTLADMGLFETKNYSFVHDERLKLFDGNENSFVYLKNPLIDTQNVMRTNLAVSLLDVLAFNISKGAKSVPVFEIGRSFFKDGDFCKEYINVGFLLWGLSQFSIYQKGRVFDFYDAKAVCEAVAGIVGVSFDYERSNRMFLHPGRSAELVVDGKSLGYVGELHPDLYTAYELKFDKKVRVLIGEINLSRLAEMNVGHLMYEGLPKLPTVWRDLAIVVDRAIRWSDIEREVKNIEGVYRVALFDIYDKLEDETKVSLTFRVVLRNDEKTFTEDEIEKIMGNVYARLKDKFNAKLRGE
ncbi:phenylalanine--tRNA ligase subunit beta [Hippea maritima]|uniref:Phenylalanine--tRNA ligase beta subunit n=1 Tax=Hippea maritima (strain ATCC 700847 / DSM 10411 / MH2) TaxID=760142 RepID=F2LY12_HIPMA|nr:phenylalanine--tRNA ligase subunit beta [Hippea maritima]AEA33277.1 Phenylalanyl-tRNA synthetase beta chain [Hippea maritima DSM 10411]